MDAGNSIAVLRVNVMIASVVSQLPANAPRVQWYREAHVRSGYSVRTANIATSLTSAPLPVCRATWHIEQGLHAAGRCQHLVSVVADACHIPHPVIRRSPIA